MLRICYEYVILTIAWRPPANTFVQASGVMSATADVFVLTVAEFMDKQVIVSYRAVSAAGVCRCVVCMTTLTHLYDK